jgi:hypothetical protein
LVCSGRSSRPTAGAAYWPEGAAAFFAANGSTLEHELARYDAVIFLHTAAMLPAGYERALDQRTEHHDEALELDERVFALYADHPRLVSIESTGSFLDKLARVTAAVRGLLDVPEPGPRAVPDGWSATPTASAPT